MRTGVRQCGGESLLATRSTLQKLLRTAEWTEIELCLHDARQLATFDERIRCATDTSPALFNAVGQIMRVYLAVLAQYNPPYFLDAIHLPVCVTAIVSAAAIPFLVQRLDRLLFTRRLHRHRHVRSGRVVHDRVDDGCELRVLLDNSGRLVRRRATGGAHRERTAAESTRAPAGERTQSADGRGWCVRSGQHCSLPRHTRTGADRRRPTHRVYQM